MQSKPTLNRTLCHAAFAAIVLAAGCGIENDFAQHYADDFWYQPTNDDVDVLWVIDDSCSMREEQETLTAGFESFVSEMESTGTDFHLGVITTALDDPHAGELIGEPPFLTADDDYVDAFRRRAEVGTGGSDKEKGLNAATLALSPSKLAGRNAGFLRPDAQLLVVFVSDEEDCSDYGALDGEPPRACYTQSEELIPVDEFVDQLQSAKPEDDMVSVGAIVGPSGPSCEDAYPGKRYATAAAYTDGMVGDICDGDWSQMLYDLGLNAVGIHTSFTLSHPAVVPTLEIRVNEVEIPEDGANGWTYDELTWEVSFHGAAVPAQGAQIHAHYEILP